MEEGDERRPDHLPEDSFTSTSLPYFERKLSVLKLSDLVTPVKGYFEETLPGLTGPFCFGFIDCDLQDSMIYCAETIWPRLEHGGRLIFDDYASAQYRAATTAIETFIANHEGHIAEHHAMRGMYTVTKA